MLRFANKNDIPALLSLLYQVGDVHHQIRPDLFREGACKYSAEDLEVLLQDANRPVLVWTEEGRIVGYAFCILQDVRGDGALCDRKTLYIDDLCVDEASRGCGAAKAIYDGVLDYARSICCQAVTLNVWCGNDRAMRFYEKCGLRPQKIGMETIL